MAMKQVLAAGAAMIALGAQGSAQAATCITRAEISGMVAYAMPSLITATRDRCRPHLTADAFVATGVDAMITAYRADQPANWPAAKSAFMKFGADGDARDVEMMAALPDAALQPMVETFVPMMIQEQVKTEQCGDIDTILASLSPMSPKQAADMLAAIMALTRDDPRVANASQPSVCSGAE